MRRHVCFAALAALLAVPAMAQENRIELNLTGLEAELGADTASANLIGLNLEYHLTDRIEIRGGYENGSSEGVPIEAAAVNLRYLHPVSGLVAIGPRLDYGWSSADGETNSETLAGLTMRLDVGEESEVDLSASSLADDFGDQMVYELDGRTYVGQGVTLRGGLTRGQDTTIDETATSVTLGGEYDFAENLYGSLLFNRSSASETDVKVNGVRLGVGLKF